MKTASIVSIGNEILSGLTVDTNAAYLSKQLMSLGIATSSGYTVGDDISRITGAIEQAARDADIILITGGPGLEYGAVKICDMTVNRLWSRCCLSALMSSGLR